jgi:GIY-YIG catalytic domain
VNAFDKKFGRAFLTEVPSEPGVYFIYDLEDHLIYIGKAKSLKRRLGQYQKPKRGKKGRRMRSILKEAAKIRWEVEASDLEASLREVRLIQTHRPRWNLVGAFTFMYPFLGLRLAAEDLHFCYTTQPEANQDFQFYGAFRSREITGEAFFALMELLPFVGHRQKARSLEETADYTYVFGFRRLPSNFRDLWDRFFRGESVEALEVLTLKLLENAGARAKKEEIQKAIDLVWRFWKHEAKLLGDVIRKTAYAEYPVAQRERDPLLLSYRLNNA